MASLTKMEIANILDTNEFFKSTLTSAEKVVLVTRFQNLLKGLNVGEESQEGFIKGAVKDMALKYKKHPSCPQSINAIYVTISNHPLLNQLIDDSEKFTYAEICHNTLVDADLSNEAAQNIIQNTFNVWVKRIQEQKENDMDNQSVSIIKSTTGEVLTTMQFTTAEQSDFKLKNTLFGGLTDNLKWSKVQFENMNFVIEGNYKSLLDTNKVTEQLLAHFITFQQTLLVPENLFYLDPFSQEEVRANEIPEQFKDVHIEKVQHVSSGGANYFLMDYFYAFSGAAYYIYRRYDYSRIHVWSPTSSNLTNFISKTKYPNVWSLNSSLLYASVEVKNQKQFGNALKDAYLAITNAMMGRKVLVRGFMNE